MDGYAIIQTGGKQYRVQEGEVIRVDSISADENDEMRLDDVRMVCRAGDVTLGSPTVSGAKVTAQVIGSGLGEKVVVFKYKSKTRYRRRKGHRQSYTDLKVTDISFRKSRKKKTTDS